VVHDGVNGYFCKDDPIDMAAKIVQVLEDPAQYKRMSKASHKIAAQFSEQTQCDKILGMYATIIRSKALATEAAHS
jgi:glycosyltransferase involved in cell wall biosynthesis